MNLKLISKWRTELMGIAAIWILYFHVGGEPLFAFIKYLNHVGNFLLAAGYCGVDIFLFLSGIGIFYSLNKKRESILEFYKKRFLRVYPAFFFLFLFAHLKSAETLDARSIISNLTFYINWKENIYNGGWYIATIMAFYLATPFYYKLFKTVKRKGLFSLIVSLVSVVLMPLYEYYNRWDLKSVVQRIPVYLVGFYVGWLLTREIKSKYNNERLLQV